MFVHGPTDLGEPFDFRSYDLEVWDLAQDMEGFFSETAADFQGYGSEPSMEDLINFAALVERYQDLSTVFYGVTKDLNGTADFDAAVHSYIFGILENDDYGLEAWWARTQRAFLHAYVSSQSDNLPSESELENSAYDVITEMRNGVAQIETGVDTGYSNDWFVKTGAWTQLPGNWLAGLQLYEGHIDEGYRSQGSAYQLDLGQLSLEGVDLAYTFTEFDNETTYEYDRWDQIFNLQYNPSPVFLELNFRQAWLRGIQKVSASERTVRQDINPSLSTEADASDRDKLTIDDDVSTPYVFAACWPELSRLSLSLAAAAQVEVVKEKAEANGMLWGHLQSSAARLPDSLGRGLLYAQGGFQSSDNNYFHPQSVWQARAGLHFSPDPAQSKIRLRENFLTAARVAARPVHPDAQAVDAEIAGRGNYPNGWNLAYLFNERSFQTSLATELGYLRADYGYRGGRSGFLVELGLRNWLRRGAPNGSPTMVAWMRMEYMSALDQYEVTLNDTAIVAAGIEVARY